MQHAASEDLGTIENALRAGAIRFEYARTFEGQALPKDPDAFSALIVMGGPMGVYETDRYSFLVSEMNLIEQFLKAHKPILGVCLGSQLLAACLGAAVRKGKRKEIGWYPVSLMAEGRHDPLWREQPGLFSAFHWHGDVFDLPAGAVSLASSRMTAVQAFHYGDRAWGLLFHLEVTRSHIRRMLTEFAEEVRQENLSGPAILQDTESCLPQVEAIAASVFGRWAKLV